MQDDPDNIENLAAEFPQATRDQWLALVNGALKGASFEKRLVSKTYDGLSIEPLYGRDAAARPVLGRRPGLPWQIVQRIEMPDAAAANAQALHDLENGATALSLVFAGAVGAYGFGLPADAVVRVLDGVILDAGVGIDLQLKTSDAATVIAGVADALKRQGVAPGATDISFGLDGLAGGDAGAIIRDLTKAGYRGPFAVADARVIHNAGGSEAQELAYALAVALAHLRTLEAAGIALGDARRMIYFRLSADADQFLTTAKFRALRKLWTRVEEACGLDARPALPRPWPGSIRAPPRRHRPSRSPGTASTRRRTARSSGARSRRSRPRDRRPSRGSILPAG